MRKIPTKIYLWIPKNCPEQIFICMDLQDKENLLVQKDI